MEGLHVLSESRLTSYGSPLTHLVSREQPNEIHLHLSQSFRTSVVKTSPAVRLLLCLFLVVQALLCWTGRERSLRGETDFRAFYAAGVAVREGRAAELYRMDTVAATQRRLFGSHGRTLPFLYPAIAALPFALLSYLPFAFAFGVFGCINVLCLYATAHLLFRAEDTYGYSPQILFAAYLSFLPTAVALMQGQISFVLLQLLAVAHYWNKQRRTFKAGLSLSLLMVKFQIALPLAIILLLWKEWSVLRGFLMGSAAFVSITLCLTGWSGASSYLLLLRTLGATMALHADVAQSRFGMVSSGEPNLHGFVSTVLGTGWASILFTLVISVGVLMVSGRKVSGLWAACPAAMLVSYHMQPYDLLLLLFPITILMPKVFARGQYSSHTLQFAFSTSLLLLTVPVGAVLISCGATTWLVLAVCGIALACTLACAQQTSGVYPSQTGYVAAIC